MTMNEKPIDRIVRSTLGLILLAIMLSLLASPTALIEGTILLVIGIYGVLLLSTGLLGWYPTYALLGINSDLC
jgi:Inner membrane protein YgaP-like, transmembrane domain